MEGLPQLELEKKVDELFDASDRLAFDAMSKEVERIRAEERAKQ